jgi:hypothetical protein
MSAAAGRQRQNRVQDLVGISALLDVVGGAGIADLQCSLLIFGVYGEGLQTDQIAEQLVLSTHTVRTHVKNALRRLGVRARRDALELLEQTDVDAPI